jgi:hypothetical protein
MKQILICVISVIRGWKTFALLCPEFFDISETGKESRAHSLRLKSPAEDGKWSDCLPGCITSEESL